MRTIDPVMWRDICLANGAALLAILDRYRTDLDHLADAIRTGDGTEIERVFRNAKGARDRNLD